MVLQLFIKLTNLKSKKEFEPHEFISHVNHFKETSILYLENPFSELIWLSNNSQMRIYKLKEEMTEISCYYSGDLRCESIHISSGEKIRTDAPVDHHGKGNNFSPTDLLATSVGTCLLTIMAIKARNDGWEIEDINLKIKKNMTENSNRKIKELLIDIFIPSNLPKLKFNFLVSAANQCPVTKSLSDSLSLKIKWHYKDLINT